MCVCVCVCVYVCVCNIDYDRASAAVNKPTIHIYMAFVEFQSNITIILQANFLRGVITASGILVQISV